MQLFYFLYIRIELKILKDQLFPRSKFVMEPVVLYRLFHTIDCSRENTP